MCRFIIIERLNVTPSEQQADIHQIVGEHEAEGQAKAGAEELAELRPASRFEVYQLTGSAALEPRVQWRAAKP